MPRRAPLPETAGLYLGALELALDATRPASEREAAGRFMRDIGDEIKARRPPLAEITRYRYEWDHVHGRHVPGDGSPMHSLVQDVLDHRICGTGDDD